MRLNPPNCLWGLLIGALVLGCADFRAKYNAFYNANKAFKKAEKKRVHRFKKDPLDSIRTSSQEEPLYRRTIAKGSKVLELYGDTDTKYLAASLFLMGKSYFRLGEWEKAITKFDELLKAYKNFEQIEEAKYLRVKCIYETSVYPIARREILNLLETVKDPFYRLDLMELFASLEKKHSSPSEGLRQYEELLSQGGLTDLFRGKIYWECAQLAFEIENWDKSIMYANRKEIKNLEPHSRYKAQLLSAQAHYQLNQKEKAFQILKSLIQQPVYNDYSYSGRLILGKWMLKQPNQVDSGLAVLRQVPALFESTPQAAEALYTIGHFYYNQQSNTDSAIFYLDSASRMKNFDFGQKAADLMASLVELRKLQNDSVSTDTSGLPTDFYIAELFLFRLEKADSSLEYLKALESDSTLSPDVSRQIAYAQAYILEEYLEDSVKSAQMYQKLIREYPGTEVAKQAERNLGQVPVNQTREDLALRLFMEAEDSLFAGYDLQKTVIPKYRSVVDSFPGSKIAGKALYIIAFLNEKQYFSGDSTTYPLAVMAYQKLLQNYKDSKYFPLAREKLAAIDVADTSKVIPLKPPVKDLGKEWEIFYKKKEEEKTKEPEYEYDEQLESEEVLDPTQNMYRK